MAASALQGLCLPVSHHWTSTATHRLSSATGGEYVLFDIELKLPSFFSCICVCSTLCKFRIPQGVSECPNRNCPAALGGGGRGGKEGFSTEPAFDLRVSLSDHSGSVEGVRLSGQPAVELLCVSVSP